MTMIDYGRICDPMTGAGFELWNNARTLAYAGNGVSPSSTNFKGCSCDTLEELLAEGQPYETPGLGPVAPWFDTADCDSAKFAGILMLDISGIDDASFERNVIAGLNEGASFGPLRKRHKEITFRALLVGRDHCGVNYGFNWFKRALTQMVEGCEFAELVMFECCPCIEPDCDGNVDYADCAEKYERTYKKVALLNGPRVTNRYGSTCGCGCGGCSLMEIEWTFAIGAPYKFRAPRKAIPAVSARNFPVQCVEWFKTDNDCSCFEPCNGVNCATGSSVAPPRAPSLEAQTTCSLPILYAQECFRIGRDSLPDSGDTVLIVSVENSSGETIEGVSVTVIPNANGTPCDELDECDACASVVAPCIPPHSTWTSDGTTRTATITDHQTRCVTGVFGAQPCFPVLDPCVDHCVCITIPGGNVLSGLKVSVSTVTREN